MNLYSDFVLSLRPESCLPNLLTELERKVILSNVPRGMTDELQEEFLTTLRSWTTVRIWSKLCTLSFPRKIQTHICQEFISRSYLYTMDAETMTLKEAIRQHWFKRIKISETPDLWNYCPVIGGCLGPKFSREQGITARLTSSITVQTEA